MKCGQGAGSAPPDMGAVPPRPIGHGGRAGRCAMPECSAGAGECVRSGAARPGGTQPTPHPPSGLPDRASRSVPAYGVAEQPSHGTPLRCCAAAPLRRFAAAAAALLRRFAALPLRLCASQPSCRRAQGLWRAPRGACGPLPHVRLQQQQGRQLGEHLLLTALALRPDASCSRRFLVQGHQRHGERLSAV
eukprot:CAMPEP_0181190430 /NCGR_PEP_ID=MMETSP1096-20121128/12189_1 /TAXON_ID=156174 ORGANISM="Chrysochromulina ericina, Strain CCMP281" /NCGR_SAMPLE_ID=MMETSP1096 /ASSEMBLY_ACC=CAM_ASM_000453 /LENGTH=189 /DNA_ID=CAMNT_0023279645 /DNA_START=385 /DNA_END=953 /DNA_ORIENTATION=+